METSPASSANRLAGEKSPYLLQHAHNPVDWRPWGEEAFAKARAEDKPIFLSIGYSTCHWCHVMAHESFENPATAAVMNELFVNVKVDREERPDVDRVYMTFVQATTGQGGWPMSVWLQPDLKPIFGGTYFPPEDRYGRRGFPVLCRALADAWSNQRERVQAQGERTLAALRDFARGGDGAAEAASETPPIADLLRAASKPLSDSFDPQWGGFGDAPKFPRPVTLHLLARIAARLGPASPEGRQACEQMLATLDAMHAGGLRDHLGGGFHRYSVDRFWHVPHFEKMLYDQAQLAVAFLEAYQITDEIHYAEAAREILDYVARDLAAPEGGFYCAEDADSLLAHGKPEHAEGAFYVWTQAEIEAALTVEEAGEFCGCYGVEPDGNAPEGSDPHGEFTGKNILITREPAPTEGREAALLESARRKLLAVRNTRPRPHLDDKILTAWNGLMISAMARAHQLLGEENYFRSARRAVDFIRARLWREADGILLRTYRQGPAAVEGFAEDYAFLIQGLLDLYEAGFDVEHLRWAERLQDRQDALFFDPAGGGYFSASGRDASVLLRLKEDHDGAEPSANSVSALNLGRLAAMTGREELRERARKTVAAFGAGTQPAKIAQTMPLLLAAQDYLSGEPLRAVIAGPPGRIDTQEMLTAIRTPFVPRKAVLLADGGDGQKFLAARLPFVETAGPQNRAAALYLCEGQQCHLPITDPTEAARRFKSFSAESPLAAE